MRPLRNYVQDKQIIKRHKGNLISFFFLVNEHDQDTFFVECNYSYDNANIFECYNLVNLLENSIINF